MGHQGNNIFFSNDNENAVVTCTCGCVEHGMIYITTYTPKNEFDDLFFIGWSGSPYATNFWHKLKNAWKLIKGVPLRGDFFSSVNEAKLLVEFLSKRIELAENQIEVINNKT